MIQTLHKLWRNHGGLHLDYHKEDSNAAPVRHLPMAEELIIPSSNTAVTNPHSRSKRVITFTKGKKLPRTPAL